MKFFTHFHKKVKNTIKEKMDIIQEKKKALEEVESLKFQKKINDEKQREKANTLIIDIKAVTVIKIVIMILLGLTLGNFVGKISGILLLIFIAIIFATAISPFVNWAQKKHIPRALSILFVYTIFLIFIGLMTTSLIPLVIEQASELLGYLDTFIQKVQNEGIKEIPFGEYIEPYVKDFVNNLDNANVLDNLKDTVQGLAKNVTSLAGNAISIAFSVFGGLLQAVTVLFLTFFMVIDTNGLEKFSISLIPHKYHKYIIKQSGKIQKKLGGWFSGQIITCFIVSTIVFIGLKIIGVEYAFTFALIAFLTEFIPVIGPLISAIICVPIILTQSLVMGLIALIFFVVLNWVESNIIVPLIMKRTIGLNPMAVIISMLIGSQLLGIIGIILAVPIAASIKVLIDDYASKDK